MSAQTNWFIANTASDTKPSSSASTAAVSSNHTPARSTDNQSGRRAGSADRGEPSASFDSAVFPAALPGASPLAPRRGSCLTARASTATKVSAANACAAPVQARLISSVAAVRDVNQPSIAAAASVCGNQASRAAVSSGAGSRRHEGLRGISAATPRPATKPPNQTMASTVSSQPASTGATGAVAPSVSIRPWTIRPGRSVRSVTRLTA